MTDGTTNIAITDALPAPRGGGLRVADPGLIGLLGFVIATVTAQLAHLGLQDDAPVFWVGAVFGGVVQVTAGMLSYFAGDNFHFIVYNAFGWYWIVVPGFLLGEELGFFEVTAQARGLFSLVFAILALLFTPAGAAHNSVLPITLLSVSLGLGLQSIAAFTATEGLAITGSILLMVASALAAYMLVEKFYWRTIGRRVVPLGPPWILGDPNPES
ncbi:acetate uptake transporter family protein [Microbacterium trichothecenolyticum]|uniref:Inner membrane protein YaaH n=1 Tax=Microbacterium trichothecenolyticum TaxID=69370 RepID=A0A0M2HFC7_MICTR|nr:GPR1/FUN34/YaaH family transporter [Microbacterium trichothecenolyticum]KJL45355.1 Inner membrane protein YaaH [Microbacterium trichothecenolyticum]